MDGPQRLTVASTWRLDNEGVDEVRSFLKGSSNNRDVFCKYESNNDVIAIENCDIAATASELAKYIASFVDEEKDNDLLEKPKISRLVIPTVIDEGDDLEPESETLLIDDFCAQDNAVLPLIVKYWRTKNGGIECFAKAPPHTLAQLSSLTGAQIVLETDNKRVRVQSVSSLQVDRALEKLSNLERSLSLACSPQVANILYMGSQKDVGLRLPSYTSINDLAFRRVLDEPESKIIGQLHKMYATVMETIDPENMASVLLDNLARPPRSTEQRKGRPRVWNDFKFPELGDASNAPDLGAVGKTDREVPEDRNPDKSSSRPEALVDDTITTDHTYLSRDKISLVDKWVAEGLEAGAVGASGTEPNNPLPTTEPIEAPKIVTGVVKLRRVRNTGASSSADPAPNPPPRQDPLDAAARRQKAREMLGPRDTGLGQQKGSDQPSPERRNTKDKPTGQQRTISLIDMLDDDAPTLSAGKSLMPFSQPPLVPSQPTPTLTSHKRAPANSSSHRSLLDSNAIDQNGLAARTAEGETDEEKEYERRLNRLKGERPHAPKEPESPSKERELVDTEVSTRRFHRTMGQKAPKAKRPTKDTQKSNRAAAIAAVLGPPSAPKAPTKQIKDPELSAWKKAQIAKEEETNNVNLKDLFTSLEPTLDAARCFTGALTVELQLGLVLTHSISKYDADRAMGTKAWNKVFRPQHGLKGPTTSFMNRLTTSGADIDFLLGLDGSDGECKAPAFSATASERFVCYEFHCQTKHNETIIINMDEAGVTTVNRPEVFLGAANVHCPHKIWDIRAAVKGTQEYLPGIDKEIDAAVQSLIENLYVYPNRSRILMFTRTLKDSQLCITKVLMKRTTRHRSVGSKNKAPTKSSSQKASSGSEEEPAVTDDAVASTPNDQRVYLQVTEVQNLFFAQHPADNTAVRVRALTSEEMVDNSRLWYEASIVSPAIERVLESNKGLEIGECTDAWLPLDLLGNKTPFNEGKEGKEEAGGSTDSLSQAAAIVGSAGIGQMYRVAKSVVNKIDSIGWANMGPAADPPENAYLSARPIPMGRPNMPVPTEASRRGISGMTMGGSMKIVETSSRYAAGPSDFW